MNDIDKGDMRLRLDNYLFAYRCTPSTVTGKPPAELFMGRKLRSTLDLLKPEIKRFENKFTEGRYREFNDEDNVFIRNYNSREKWVPGTIVKRIGKVLYDIRVNDKIFRRHVNQIIRNQTSNVNVRDISDDYITYDYDCNDEPCQRPVLRSRRIITRDPYPQRDRRPVNRYGFS